MLVLLANCVFRLAYNSTLNS